MPRRRFQTANRLRWQHQPGHYEVYYLTFSDAASGCGGWIRYTMLAPQAGGEEPTCALWFAAMDAADPMAHTARKQTLPISQLAASTDPFGLRIGDAQLTDTGAHGGFDDVEWKLSWSPS